MNYCYKTALFSLFISSVCSSNFAYAGGVALGATRIIYPSGEKQVSLPISNTSSDNTFLIQSWVSDADGNKVNDFIVTPPLFVIAPNKENTTRIMYVGEDLPSDRESVFYFNSKAIPSTSKEKASANSLQIATQSVIKLFVRPRDLETSSFEAPENLTCSIIDSELKINNPTPYFVSLININLDGRKINSTMINPFDKLTFKIRKSNFNKNMVSFQSINDYGAETATQFCK